MRCIIATLLFASLLPLSPAAQKQNSLSDEERQKYYEQYPYIQVTSRLYTLESEFTWPEGFARPRPKKLTPFQNWVSGLPLWEATMPVAAFGGREVYAPETISRVVPLPWRTNRLEDHTIPLQIAFEYLLLKGKLDQWKVLPMAGDTMTYDKWLVSATRRDARGRLMFVPGETRFADSLEQNRFFNLIANNTNYLSLTFNCDSVSESSLAPGDLLVARDSVGNRGRVYIILGVIGNEAGEKRFVVGTGCPKPACDLHIPLFHGDQSNPWLTLDEVKALAPSEFKYSGFFRLRLPVK